MAKYLKIQSLILCVCLMLTAFSGISAFAADPFALVSWNADSDFITLDFNQDIDVSTADITLTKDGVDVPFTFAKNDYSNKVQTTNDSTASTDVAKYFTYFVTPTGGIDLDEVYTLTVNAIENADGTEAITPITKTFLVKDLGGELTNYRTVGVSAGKVTYDTSVPGQVSASLTTFTTSYSESNNAFIGTQVGKDFENATPMTNASASNALWEETDYTVKLKIKIEGATKENIYFGIADNVNRITYGSFTGTYMQLQRQNETDPNYNFREDRSSSNTYAHNGTLNGGNRPTGMDYSDLDLKISTKDLLAHAYVENKKMADMTLTADAKGWVFVSIEAITKASGSNVLVATVSDLLVTRCYEVCSTEIDKTADVEIEDDITITFGQDVDTATMSNIKLVDSEGVEVENYSVTPVSSTEALVEFSGLEYRSEYTLEFDDVETLADIEYVAMDNQSFTTVEPPIELASFEITDGEFGGTVSLEAVIANNTQVEDFDFIATIAIYNSLGQMVKIAGDTYSLATGEDATVTVADFVCDPEETYTAKCFVWDSFTGMNTIFEGIIE